MAIDARRRAKRRAPSRSGARVGGDDSGDLEGAAQRPGLAEPVGDPQEVAVRAETERKVHAALDRLSPKLRAVVVLRYFENLSYEDLADVLQTSIGTVKSRLNRAHAALEGILGPLARGQG
jgi:RNA polymerase sigma-70 factor (ECF subfamily)